MAQVLRGIAAAPGLAKGAALHLSHSGFEIPRYRPEDLQAEVVRLAEARNKANAQLRALMAEMEQQAGVAEAAVFEAQAMFLSDPVLVARAETEISRGQNAEQAWHAASEFFAGQLDALPDATLRARAADVRDVSRRVIDILCGRDSARSIRKQGVIVARDLAPSQTAALDRSLVTAFCTAEGGPTSHTAILSRALGIPAVVGLGEVILDVAEGTVLLVDGESGEVIVDPSPDMEESFHAKMFSEQKARAGRLESALRPAVTRDGHRVEVVANVGHVEDARSAVQYGAEGIGLLRTEFLFLNREQMPDEEAQFESYRVIFDLMGGRPVVVRTLDIGADKEVPYLDFGAEANPFLGYRAIRISLDHPDDFKMQLRALLRAGADHDLRVMFPMIATLEEVRRAKELVAEAQDELKSRSIASVKNPQIGIMVEIPSVALLADLFAREVDFFSIGTNDLTQYTLAAERGNKRVSRLNDPCHPAVLRQIEQVVRAAREEGIWVGVCGEMGGDPQAIPILLGLGVNELSMASAQIPSAKQIVREWKLEDARALAQRTLRQESAEAVRRLVDEFSL
jgi:phosphoenolpyruvate-protein phosphotransferase